MFSVVGTAQGARAGGRSGPAGIPVHGSLMGHFSLCIWLPSLFFFRKTRSGVKYDITCDQDSAHVYIGETKRPLGKRFKFKEHTNLTIATGVGDSGHSVSLNNTKVLTREPQ